MDIEITQKQIIELNKIRRLLRSPDIESRVLGLTTFLNNEIVIPLSQLFYVTKREKDVPISWFFGTASKYITEGENDETNRITFYKNAISLVSPIIESLLNGVEFRFKSYINIKFIETEDV